MAVFRFNNAPLFFTSNMVVRDQLLAALRNCDQDSSVNAILLVDSTEKAGSLEYAEFFRENIGQRHRLRIHRMLNAFSQLIEAIVSNDKLVVFADGGAVISQFLNVSLACDYRVVADNTVIQKAYLHHGMVPKGGGAYFLSRLLGRSAALQLLLSEDDISAAEALALGIVDKVVPVKELEEVALAVAADFAAKPTTTTTGLKRLMRYQMHGFADYLAFEHDQILRILDKADFSQADD